MVIEGEECEGAVFYRTAIESIKLPSALKRIDALMFGGCENLKSVEVPHGVEYIGAKCFGYWRAESGIEEVTLPNTLKEIDENALRSSYSLKVVWIEDGCTLDIKEYVSSTVEIFPAG